jgi:uncharacterized protein YggE
MNRGVSFLVIVLSICLFSSLPAFGQDSSKAATIEVTGKASIMTMPDTVTIMFSVETESTKANDAVVENAERTSKVIGALKKIAEKDTKLETSGYTLFPVYEKEKTDRTALYRVRNTVIVESKDLGKVGVFIDQAAEAGVSRISDVTFMRDKSEEIGQEAAAKALKNAIRDAEILAKAAGLSVKRILKITYDQRDHYPLRNWSVVAQPAATPISVGEIKVQAIVQVVFELNQPATQ